MSNLWPILLVIVLVGAGLAVGAIAADRRRKALAELAARIGLDFAPHPDDVHDRYHTFTPFGSGHSHRSSNLLHGRRGEIEWEVFDYRYTTGSGKNKRTHRCGIAAATVPLFFRRLAIRPEGWFDKVASLAGWDDINFESEEFSRRYHVSCEVRKFAYDVVHPQMIEYLLRCTPRHWQLAGNVILIHKSGNFAPADVEDAMAMVEGLLSRIPEYVRQDSGLRAGSA